MSMPQTNVNPQALEVGKKVVEYCNAARFVEAVDELYAPDIVSVETYGSELMPARIQGIDKVRGKSQWWIDNHEIHASKAEGPWPHGDRFIVKFTMDVTPKVGPFAGKRMKIEEAGLYTVKNGKIVHEEFFYHM